MDAIHQRDQYFIACFQWRNGRADLAYKVYLKRNGRTPQADSKSILGQLYPAGYGIRGTISSAALKDLTASREYAQYTSDEFTDSVEVRSNQDSQSNNLTQRPLDALSVPDRAVDNLDKYLREHGMPIVDDERTYIAKELK